MTGAAVPERGPAPATTAGAAAAVPLERTRTRILVVDDDPRNLLALSEVLDDIADVARANSGDEALRFLLQEQFAVIILDVLMPGLDGYETAALVRQREQSRDTPIIFLTAINKEDAHLLRGYDSGAVDYVFKPFEPTILRSKVKVFVSLYEKTREIEQKAMREQQLLRDNLRAREERLLANEALRAAEERQALILRSLPLAVYADEEPDRERAPRFVAGDITGLTGFPPEAFERDHGLWMDRVHPDDRHAAELGTDDLVAGECSREYRWQHADGTYRHLVDQTMIIVDRDGLVAAGTVLDITERRHLQDQLLQSQKLDAIGKLTGGIAHDFNNLLASIMGGLHLLERRVELNDGAKQVIEMTRHAAQRGTHLVNRMLAFSRRQNLSPEVVRLDKICESLGAMLSPLLGGKTRLDWDVPEGIWALYVDPAQLELAIMNLVLNARDAMPSGGTITIGVDNRHATRNPDLEAGDYVVIAVSDTGAGIPPELIEKVVEPFFTTKEVGKGTGLGLSTAYGLARQSGGTMRIDSTVGRGTCVEIWLPRSMTEDAEPAGESVADQGRTDGMRQPRSILLVDDSASLLRLTEMQLTDAGYTVASASGGAQALAMIEQEPDRFDLIVTDYAMPLISGLEVIRFARGLRADWPAVIITGYADMQDIGDRPPDVPLVTKPFALERLLKAISGSAAAMASKRGS